jgi:hypothetical protein
MTIVTTPAVTPAQYGTVGRRGVQHGIQGAPGGRGAAEEQVHIKDKLGGVENGPIGLEHTQHVAVILGGRSDGNLLRGNHHAERVCMDMPRKAMMAAMTASGLVNRVQLAMPPC